MTAFGVVFAAKLMSDANVKATAGCGGDGGIERKRKVS